LQDPAAQAAVNGDYATLVSINNSSGTRDDPVKRKKYGCPSECADAIKQNRNTSAQILFLCGFPSRDWIKHVGSACRIEDYEFFRWNMRYQCRRDYNFGPSLPSATTGIIKLRFTTIGDWGSGSPNKNQAAVDKSRTDASNEMKIYEKKLQVGQHVSTGDSIVREYHVLDHRHFALEQEMLITATQVGDNWTGELSLYIQ
jgi:hypothetical protein